MKNSNKKNICFIGIIIIVSEIILLFLSSYIAGHYGAINNRYETRDGAGMYFLLIYFVIIILIGLLIIQVILFFSVKDRKNIAIVIASWVFIGISSILSIFPIFMNITVIKNEIKTINERNKTPFCYFCLGCDFDKNFPTYEKLNSNPLMADQNDLIYGVIFPNGDAIVVKNNKFGVINMQGEFIIQPQYDCIKDYRNGVAIIYKGEITSIDRDCFGSGKFGAVNISGDTIIKLAHHYLLFRSDNVIMEFGDMYNISKMYLRLYNIKGELIRDKTDLNCSKFKYGIAFAQDRKNGSSILDTCGKNILTYYSSTFDDIFKLYVINKIVQNYQIYKLDEKLMKYIYFEKPKRRKEKLIKFHYDSLERGSLVAIIYHDYFKTIKLFGGNISYAFEPIDSAQFDVNTEKFDMTLSYYTKNDSIITYNIRYK